MGCVQSREHAAVKDENVALKARVSLVQTSSQEYEQRLHRASQNELQYQDQIENERMAMQAAVADLERSLRDCQTQVEFERSQFAEREVELDRLHQERLTEMRTKSDTAKLELVEVTESLDARIHFEKTGRTQMETSLTNQSTIVGALQGQLAQSLSSFSALQEENKQLVLQLQYYSSKLKKLHSQAVRKSQDLEDEESFGWDDMVEEVEEAVSEAPTSHRASPTDLAPVSHSVAASFAVTPSTSSERAKGVDSAVDRPAALPWEEGLSLGHQTDETNEVFEVFKPQAAPAGPGGSTVTATAAESTLTPGTSTRTSASTATCHAAAAVVRVELASPPTSPVLEDPAPASDTGTVTNNGDLHVAPALAPAAPAPAKETDAAVSGPVGHSVADPGTDPGTEDKMLLEQLLSDGPSTLVAKGSPASAPVEHVVSPTAADFGHLKSVMGNLTQNVYGAEAVASPPPIASLLRSDEQGAEIDGEYIEVGGKGGQAVQQSVTKPGPPVTPPVPVPVGPLGGQSTHPTNSSPDTPINTSAQKSIEPDEEDDTDDTDDDMEV